jgi:hypothetical protein
VLCSELTFPIFFIVQILITIAHITLEVIGGSLGMGHTRSDRVTRTPSPQQGSLKSDQSFLPTLGILLIMVPRAVDFVASSSHIPCWDSNPRHSGYILTIQLGRFVPI